MLQIKDKMKEAFSEISLGGGYKNVILYPYGRNGKIAKELLNLEYGIQEKFVVDNRLSKKYSQVKSIDEIENPNDYLWVITCSDPVVHSEIVKTLKADPENVVDIFKVDLQQNQKENESEFKLIHLRDSVFGLNVVAAEVIECVKKKKAEGAPVCVAEVGVGVGTTSVGICEELDEEDTYYCFDFEETIKALSHDLGKLDSVKCKVKGYGNSHYEFDSYNWALSNLVLEMKESGKQGIFDVVYLDGAHDFLHDSSACCMLKKLLKLGGYIVFDDVWWTWDAYFNEIDDSLQTTWIQSHYTEEQTKDCQIHRVLEIFMEEDGDFKRLSPLKNSRGVYQKLR